MMDTALKMSYLLLVDNEGNHNKYYRMVQENNATFRAEYGRVGAKPALKPYPMSLWDKKYNEKIRKGYVDKTDLYETSADSDGFVPIAEARTNRLVQTLLMAARKYVKKHYTFSCTTQEAVDSARTYIRQISEVGTATEINRLFLELFATIPRRMSNVKDLYFHGSITPNYWNILSLGLDPAKAARGMFGYGTYFASWSRNMDSPRMSAYKPSGRYGTP